MTPDERVAAVRTVAAAIEGESWDDIRLIFEAFEAPEPTDFSGNKRELIYATLKGAGDNKLAELLAYATKGNAAPAPPPADAPKLPWNPIDFRLFASHSSEDKELVAEVKRRLGPYAIDLFVAHDDIDPSEEWLQVIEVALGSCDALTAFLTDHFHPSKWCDQEVGLAMSRHVHLIPISLGVTPYGFMGQYQGLRAGSYTAEQIAFAVFEILVGHELTAARMSEALVGNVAEASSFAQANQGVKLLRYVSRWTPELLRQLENSLEANNQVRGSYATGTIESIIAGHRT
jgi:TIR domain-containing protein